MGTGEKLIEDILREEGFSLGKIIRVQTIIHTAFTSEDLGGLNHIQLDKHLFERTNLAIEELVEANRELVHRKPHRVTREGVAIDAKTARTDIDKFKSELVDATQIIFSILGALETSEEEFFEIWKSKVNKIKGLTADTKYE